MLVFIQFPGLPSLWYICYKALLCIVLCVFTVSHILSTLDRLGSKWLIFLTNQGMMLLILHNLLHTAIIIKKRIIPSNGSSPSLPLVYKISWSLQSITSSISLFITTLYWLAVHGYVVEHHLLLNTADWVFNFFLHLSNTVFSLLDLFLTARPVSLFHAYLPVIFGVCYSIFTLIYGLAGGEFFYKVYTLVKYPVLGTQVKVSVLNPFVILILFIIQL